MMLNPSVSGSHCYNIRHQLAILFHRYDLINLLYMTFCYIILNELKSSGRAECFIYLSGDYRGFEITSIRDLLILYYNTAAKLH